MDNLNPLAEEILLQPLRLYQMIYRCICVCMSLVSMPLFRSTRSAGSHAYESPLSPHFLITFIVRRKRTLIYYTIIVAAQSLLKADSFQGIVNKLVACVVVDQTADGNHGCLPL